MKVRYYNIAKHDKTTFSNFNFETGIFLVTTSCLFLARKSDAKENCRYNQTSGHLGKEKSCITTLQNTTNTTFSNFNLVTGIL